MENKSLHIWLGLILGLVIIIAVLLVVQSIKDNKPYVITNGNLQKNTLTVPGSSDIEVVPNQAEIYFRIETKDINSKIAQSKNTEISNNFIQVLKSDGFSSKDIETII